MSDKKKVAVILSGCGVYDGSEIHEATLTLLALDMHGAKAVAAAPDIVQAKVVNHAIGKEMPGENRNVLIESARIARGDIRQVSELDVDELDAAILPGGFGAAINLSDFATAGADVRVERTVSDFLGRMHLAKKPIAALCIAPPILARVLKDAGVEGAKLTIGNDPSAAAGINAIGQEHVACPADSFVADQDNLIVSCPCYMLAEGIAELWKGIEATVVRLLEMV
ncbi:MAG: isoprenoid biosynthesis glyoxalase ElbB [Deltaproteobacteria bacterium]|nr:isoprenoid biosynthesis glyoxalase ElbB [Deltaproteobacteria bacterium]